MAEEVIKKARVLEKNLSPILSELDGYLVRYRIKSSDQNRSSHWSPFILIQPEYTFVKGSIKHTSASQIFNATWDAVPIIKSYISSSTITTKELTSKVAKITTSEAHYLNVGDYVTVSDLDATFNGTHQITAVTSTPSHTFSFYKNENNISSTSDAGTYTKNYLIKNANEYDVWIKWDKNDGGDWIYKQRIAGTSISLPHASTYTIGGVLQSSAPNKVSIEIYLKGQPPKRGDGVPGDSGSPYLKVYQLLNQTI